MSSKAVTKHTNPVNKIGRLDLAAMAAWDYFAPTLLGPGHEELRPAVERQARKLRPGRPGSITNTVTLAVRTAKRVRDAETGRGTL